MRGKKRNKRSKRRRQFRKKLDGFETKPLTPKEEKWLQLKQRKKSRLENKIKRKIRKSKNISIKIPQEKPLDWEVVNAETQQNNSSILNWLFKYFH